MSPEALVVVAEASLSLLLFSCSDDAVTSLDFSIGVGGVIVVTGVVNLALGGVFGGMISISNFGVGLSIGLYTPLFVLPILVGVSIVLSGDSGDLLSDIVGDFSAVPKTYGADRVATGLLSGLVLGLGPGLFDVFENTSRIFLAGDFARSRPKLLLLLSGSSARRVSALSINPGIGRTGVDWSVGMDLGEGSGTFEGSGSTMTGNVSVEV